MENVREKSTEKNTSIHKYFRDSRSGFVAEHFPLCSVLSDIDSFGYIRFILYWTARRYFLDRDIVGVVLKNI